MTSPPLANNGNLADFSTYAEDGDYPIKEVVWVVWILRRNSHVVQPATFSEIIQSAPPGNKSGKQAHSDAPRWRVPHSFQWMHKR